MLIVNDNMSDTCCFISSQNVSMESDDKTVDIMASILIAISGVAKLALVGFALTNAVGEKNACPLLKHI